MGTFHSHKWSIDRSLEKKEREKKTLHSRHRYKKFVTVTEGSDLKIRDEKRSCKD